MGKQNFPCTWKGDTGTVYEIPRLRNQLGGFVAWPRIPVPASPRSRPLPSLRRFPSEDIPEMRNGGFYSDASDRTIAKSASD
jgi:hypothetical protein